jgi:hypothetical protein
VSNEHVTDRVAEECVVQGHNRATRISKDDLDAECVQFVEDYACAVAFGSFADQSNPPEKKQSPRRIGGGFAVLTFSSLTQ